MKKLMTAAAIAALAMGSAPAFAAAGTAQTYTFDATVAARCDIAGASLVHFGALTDATGAYMAGATVATAVDSAAYCNQAGTTATVTHSNLTTSNGTSAGFAKTVVFTSNLLTSVDGGLTYVSKVSGDSSGAVNAFDGLKVTATLTAPSQKLIAGTYNGSITVTLVPTA